MAGAVAETRPSQEAATILKKRRDIGSRDCDGPLAGHTHAPNPLPRRAFAPYIAAETMIPRDRLSRIE
jgi:hypothetical protein